MNKRGIIGLIILVIALLIGGFFIFMKYNKTTNQDVCKIKQDCVRVQTTCCPCQNGGEEKCVSASEAENYTKQLENCPPPEELVCATVFNCNPGKCECINNECGFTEG